MHPAIDVSDVSDVPDAQQAMDAADILHVQHAFDALDVLDVSDVPEDDSDVSEHSDDDYITMEHGDYSVHTYDWDAYLAYVDGLIASGFFGPASDIDPAPNMDFPAATAFVNELTGVSIADIPRDSMRCAHCWADYDEEGLEVDATPVKTPCGHLYMRGCLIEALVDTSMPVLCPVCRHDMVASQSPGNTPT